MSTDADHPADLSFEQALEKLEALVEKLEDDDLNLESAMDAYEEGVTLAQHCQEQLEAAELRVEELSLD